MKLLQHFSTSALQNLGNFEGRIVFFNAPVSTPTGVIETTRDKNWAKGNEEIKGSIKSLVDEHRKLQGRQGVVKNIDSNDNNQNSLLTSAPYRKLKDNILKYLLLEKNAGRNKDLDRFLTTQNELLGDKKFSDINELRKLLNFPSVDSQNKKNPEDPFIDVEDMFSTDSFVGDITYKQWESLLALPEIANGKDFNDLLSGTDPYYNASGMSFNIENITGNEKLSPTEKFKILSKLIINNPPRAGIDDFYAPGSLKAEDTIKILDSADADHNTWKEGMKFIDKVIGNLDFKITSADTDVLISSFAQKNTTAQKKVLLNKYPHVIKKFIAKNTAGDIPDILSNNFTWAELQMFSEKYPNDYELPELINDSIDTKSINTWDKITQLSRNISDKWESGLSQGIEISVPNNLISYTSPNGKYAIFMDHSTETRTFQIYDTQTRKEIFSFSNDGTNYNGSPNENSLVIKAGGEKVFDSTDMNFSALVEGSDMSHSSLAPEKILQTITDTTEKTTQDAGQKEIKDRSDKSKKSLDDLKALDFKIRSESSTRFAEANPEQWLDEKLKTA